MITTIRLILGMLLLTCGVIVTLISITGIYKFKFIMNRMHSAAVVDTLGLLLIILGLVLISWNMAYIPKLLLVLGVQWIGSPLASHMVGILEISTDKTAGEHMAESHMEEKES